jgi:dienelactone hydrolase
LVILAALLTLGHVSIRAQSQLKRDVDLTAIDGIKLKATYFAATKPGPAIMLLHMCGDANRKTWDDLGSKLAADGFHVLALDYRGYGESGDTPSRQQDSAAEKLAEAKWPFDIDIGLAYLLAQPGVNGKSIGVGGASCGVDNSVTLAVRHPEVKSLVLLSGGTDLQGLNYIRQNPSLAILGAASRDDNAVAPYMRWLLGFSPNTASRFMEFEKAGHGTDMFAAEKSLEPAIVQWFVETLQQPPAEFKTPLPKAGGGPDLEFWSAITAPDGATRAMEIYRSSKSRHPDATPFPVNATILLGDERLKSGNLWDALQFFKLSVEAYPNSTYAHYRLAQAYHRQGNRGLSVSIAEHALQLVEKDNMRDETREYFREIIRKLLAELGAARNK